jgi:CBS domain-containing protein
VVRERTRGAESPEVNLSDLSHMPAIKSVMTPFPYSVELDASVRMAQARMAEHGIRHLPVVDHNGDLVGVLTDRDLKRGLDPNVGLPDRDELLVRDVCVLDAYIVDLNTPLDTVLVEMADRHIGSTLVVHHGRLAGIFTATDACRAFGDVLRSRFPGSGGEVA